MGSNDKKFCEFCGTQIDADSNICWSCGKKVTNNEDSNKKNILGVIGLFVICIICFFSLTTSMGDDLENSDLSGLIYEDNGGIFNSG